jgi:hypothetical protein
MVGSDTLVLSGNQSYSSMRTAIDEVLASVGANASTTAQ